MCGKYVGSTTDKFRYRWSNYKNCQRKAERGEDHMQKYLHDYFLSEDNGGLLNVNQSINQSINQNRIFRIANLQMFYVYR